MSDRVFLTTKQAISMLPDGETIHTFINSAPGIMLGADHDRDDLLLEIHNKTCELGGEQCQAMNHGLVVWRDKTEPLFVECRKGINYEEYEAVTD